MLADPPYEYLAAGDLGDPNANPPVPPTGNLAEFGGQPVVHVEWESGTLPPYAWPSAGDRLKLWGSWVWDCGHWGQGFTADPDPAGTVISDTDYFLPGTNQAAGLRGESTEFHPMRAVIATRESPYEPAVQESEADVFISTQGTTAGAESRCALEHPPPTPLSYGPDWTACINDPASARQPVNDRDYAFSVPAPPQPAPGAELRYRVVDRGAPGPGPDEIVTPQADGIDVTVPFEGFGGDTGALGFAKSFYVAGRARSSTGPRTCRWS